MEIILILAGILIGVGLTALFKHRKPTGYLRVDDSDPSEKPYLFLELNESLESVTSKKYVVLEVKIKNYISQK